MAGGFGCVTKMRKLAFCLPVVALATAPWTAARATVLFNNIGLVRTPIAGGVSLSGVPYASFATGAQSAVLNSLSFDLTSQTPADGGSVKVLLYKDSGSGPTGRPTSLASLLDSALSSSAGVYSVSVSAALAANARYWIALSQSGGASGNDKWNYVSSSAGTGAASEYDYYTNNSPALSANSLAQAVYLMEVTVSSVPVPEPSPLLWMAGPLVVLGLARGLRRPVL